MMEEGKSAHGGAVVIVDSCPSPAESHTLRHKNLKVPAVYMEINDVAGSCQELWPGQTSDLKASISATDTHVGMTEILMIIYIDEVGI